MTAKDQKGRRRLDDPADLARLEIETALKRSIPIVPVRVEGADIPRREEVPDSLSDFVHRTATELSDARWSYDVGRLITWLKERERTKAGESAPSRSEKGQRAG